MDAVRQSLEYSSSLSDFKIVKNIGKVSLFFSKYQVRVPSVRSTGSSG